MSESDTSSSGGPENGLPTEVFIAIISIVGAVVFLLALLMICSFIIFCYREYRKRSGFRKASDRVGLLPSNGKDDDIISDQFEEDIKQPPLTSMELKASGSVEKRVPLVAAITNGNKVTPQGVNNGAARQRKRKSKKESEDMAVTMIEGGSDDDGDKEVSVFNSGLDDLGDETQLIPSTGKKTVQKKTKEMDLESKARLLGRPVAYMEKLSKSNPFNTEEICQLPLDKHTVVTSGPVAKEYQGVPSNAAELPDQSAAERAKNRYRNVLPNRHSAVTLKSTGADGSTYINANFIRGLHGEEKSFIASQGPIFETMSDFWRMVWEHDVNIIVMLTNLIENGRHKCVKYWPPANGKDEVTHGNMKVTSIQENVDSSYTLSTLNLKNLETGAMRTIYHFWYIAWPDFGIPSTAEHILKLRSAVQESRAKSHIPGPVVVHCSAGLGRSGTFIAIDMGITQYEEDGVVDPLKYLCEMRQDRGGMIQTSDQFFFVYKALAEYMNK